MEPPNIGQVALTDVHYLEVVLYWEFLPKILYDILSRILIQCGYKVVYVGIRKILYVLECRGEAET